ncbi:enoyl-CoA hydratase/isomerase family protein [Sinanaerobacter chloroacetimidivorans]|uniref:short-chain-enoyl-CoA hydratase n=1 Tax=Sinanaerobacter chloroacetimidivorans TaxID=2818044 RepID=A0A8J8B0W9_9FIRM|nr:enoyl-CoA hydratase-related protein [Sinanaerobacter chloroacetimidivorans]MBR0598073.1 enoyl-CoA hydratase/isomerase family protein [Sinanaerobacter chloroacetimidivorans]
MEFLIYEIIGQIAVIKINRPKALNALNPLVIKELDAVIKEIEESPDVKVLILGSNNHFAAGADIKGMVDCDVEEAKSFSFSNSLQNIHGLRIPTIAAIDGYALGGGLELALTCDFRIASSAAKLGFPEINLGIMPGAGGTIRAPRLIGESKAKELIFFGEMIDANEAQRIGLVNQVVEKEQLMDTAMEWARKLSEKAPIALKAAKETIEAGLEEPRLREALKIEDQNWAGLFATSDQKEGMRAFIEKRKAVYLGK